MANPRETITLLQGNEKMSSSVVNGSSTSSSCSSNSVGSVQSSVMFATPTASVTPCDPVASPMRLLERLPERQDPELLGWADMPQHLQFNPYVLTGYRPLQTVRGCMYSLFYWHNETINILTHGELFSFGTTPQ